MAATYPEQLDLLEAVRAAAADIVGLSVSGLSNVTIHTEGAGPDFMNESANIFMVSQDFRVTYSQAR